MKILRALVFIAFILIFLPPAFAYEAQPAKWNHSLYSSFLTDYKKGEHLVISYISTGFPGVNSVIKYGVELKITQWDKPFSSTAESPDKKTKETLRVTLHELPDSKEMRADFDHQVFQDGKLFLKFSGSTLLSRWN